MAKSSLNLQFNSYASRLGKCPNPLDRDATVFVARVKRHTVGVFPESVIVSGEIGLLIGLVQVDGLRRVPIFVFPLKDVVWRE